MRYFALVLMAVAVVAANQDEPRPQICIPGQQTKMDCNICICSEDGTSQGCTFMLCLPKLPEIRLPRQVAEQVCQPGATKNQDCNACVCDEEGKRWVCTELPCVTDGEPKN